MMTETMRKDLEKRIDQWIAGEEKYPYRRGV